MDKYYNNFINEAPYDRVSNLINSNIQSYKDGKDSFLLNGEKDLTNKSDILNRFYDNLKSELEKTTGTDKENNTTIYGKQIGRFLFNNTNDCVELSNSLESTDESKSLSNKSLTVLKAVVMEIFEEIIDKCDRYKKINDELAKGIGRNDVNVNITYTMKNNKNNFRELILDKNLDDSIHFYKFKNDKKLKDILIGSLMSIYLSDSPYLNRSIMRLKNLNDINSSIMNMMRISLDLSKSKQSDIVAMNSEIKSKIKFIEKNSDLNDIFVFDNVKYTFNINTFSITKKDDMFNDRGIFFKDYLYNDKNKIDQIVDPNEKVCLHSFMSMCESKKLKTLLDSNSRVGSGDLTISKEVSSINAKDIVDEDLTIGEYFSIEENILNASKSFQKNSEEAIKTSIKAINYGLMKLKTYISNSLKEVKELKINEFINNSAKFSLYMMVYGYLGILSSYEAAELVLAKDLVERHELSFLINELLSSINYILDQEK